MMGLALLCGAHRLSWAQQRMPQPVARLLIAMNPQAPDVPPQFRRDLIEVRTHMVRQFTVAVWTHLPGVRPEVTLLATQYDLWHALHDPQTKVLIWLSHSSQWLGNTPYLVQPLWDAQGFDVSPIFQTVLPSLRYLAVIGCGSSHVLLQEHPNWMRASWQPRLRVYANPERVSAPVGFQQALDQLQFVDLENAHERQGPTTPATTNSLGRVRILIERINGNNSTANLQPLRIENNSRRVLGMLTTEARLTLTVADTALRITAGRFAYGRSASGASSVNFGDIHIRVLESDLPSHCQPRFELLMHPAMGRPLGQESRVFVRNDGC